MASIVTPSKPREEKARYFAQEERWHYSVALLWVMFRDLRVVAQVLLERPHLEYGTSSFIIEFAASEEMQTIDKAPEAHSRYVTHSPAADLHAAMVAGAGLSFGRLGPTAPCLPIDRNEWPALFPCVEGNRVVFAVSTKVVTRDTTGVGAVYFDVVFDRESIIRAFPPAKDDQSVFGSLADNGQPGDIKYKDIPTLLQLRHALLDMRSRNLNYTPYTLASTLSKRMPDLPSKSTAADVAARKTEVRRLRGCIDRPSRWIETKLEEMIAAFECGGDIPDA